MNTQSDACPPSPSLFLPPREYKSKTPKDMSAPFVCEASKRKLGTRNLHVSARLPACPPWSINIYYLIVPLFTGPDSLSQPSDRITRTLCPPPSLCAGFKLPTTLRMSCVFLLLFPRNTKISAEPNHVCLGVVARSHCFTLEDCAHSKNALLSRRLVTVTLALEVFIPRTSPHSFTLPTTTHHQTSSTCNLNPDMQFLCPLLSPLPKTHNLCYMTSPFLLPHLTAHLPTSSLPHST
jgi:hypothetical protein